MDTQLIPIQLLDPPKVLLRSLDKESHDYQDLVSTIRDQGLHNSILVRPSGDRFEVVDGWFRTNACTDLGLDTIPAIVKPLTDWECLVCQLQANVVRHETSRVDIARQLLKIQAQYPGIKIAQLAAFAGRSTVWVRQQLRLLELQLDYQIEVERGLIPVLNAYELAKLPPYAQADIVQQARTMPPDEFKELVLQRSQNMSEETLDRRKEGMAKRDFPTHAFLRTLPTLKSEITHKTAARALIAAVRPANVVDAFTLGVQWATNTDPLSLEERRERHLQSKPEDETPDPFL